MWSSSFYINIISSTSNGPSKMRSECFTAAEQHSAAEPIEERQQQQQQQQFYGR